MRWESAMCVNLKHKWTVSDGFNARLGENRAETQHKMNKNARDGDKRELHNKIIKFALLCAFPFFRLPHDLMEHQNFLY